MGWAAAIPAALSAVGSIAKMAGGGGGGQQQQPQAMQPMMLQNILPQNPFPMNMADGGKPAGSPSMLDPDLVVGGRERGVPVRDPYSADEPQAPVFGGVGDFLRGMFR